MIKNDIKIEEGIIELNSLLKKKRKKILKDFSYPAQPPVFIVGAPRSGTTLLYQLLISQFDLTYIDNISAKFWELPLYGISLSNELFPFEKRIFKKFESQYGFTEEAFGPHEFGYFWKRWFKYKNTDVLSESQTKKINFTEIQKEFDSLTKFRNKSVVFKNAVAVSMQFSYLTDIFWDAKFIICRRHPLFNAQSLYLSRINRNNDPSKWFSARPREYNKLKKRSPEEQVIGQVFYCREIENNTLNKLDRENKIRYKIVNYEELCENPVNVINGIEELLNKSNLNKKDFIPASFENQNKRILSEKQFQNLEKYNKKYFLSTK